MVDSKRYEISHSLDASCVSISVEELSWTTCFNRTSDSIERITEYGDGLNQTRTWSLYKVANPTEIIATDLTGYDNVHFDLRLNITDGEEQDIHMTGFLNENETSWSWTAQSGENSRLLMTNY